jgi:hypothetical protein
LASRPSSDKSQPPPIELPEDIAQGFVDKLHRQITDPAKGSTKMPLYEWHMKYRRFDGFPPSVPWPMIDIYSDMHPEVIVMKAAQVFISEWGISTVLWAADQRWAERGVCLYVFPKQEQMDDFSQDRVQRAIQESPYLEERVSHIERGDRGNRTRLRKIGGRPCYFRGSDTIMQTRSIDADVVVLDEVDLFKKTSEEDAISRVKQRMGSSLSPLFRAFSQPLYPGGPIDELYADSDQRHYYLTCEHCSHKQHLEWEKNVVFPTNLSEVKIVCYKCREPMDRLAKGEWVAHNQDSRVHGYHINKLYSPRADLVRMLRDSVSDDPMVVQSFWNADLGLPYRPDGTPGLEEFSREQYPWMAPFRDNFMGIDVGRQLHISIVGRDNWDQPFKLVFRKAVNDFSEVDQIFKVFHPEMCIIDGQGDPRATLEWAEQYPGVVYRWFHRNSAHESDYRDDGQVIYHRTNLLDLMYMFLKTHQCILHEHAGKEYFDHLEANIREMVQNPSTGRWEPRYMPSRANDYAFSLAFAILATGQRPADGVSGIMTGWSNDLAKMVPVSKDSDEEAITLSPSYVTGDGKWGRWRP